MCLFPRVMWRFVSLFSEKDERQLQKLYKYIKSNRMDKFKVSQQDRQRLARCPRCTHLKG